MPRGGILGWLDGVRRWVHSLAAPQSAARAGAAPSFEPAADASPLTDAPADTPANAPANASPDSPVAAGAPVDAPAAETASPDALTPDASVSPSEAPNAELPPAAPAYRAHPLRATIAFVTRSLPVFLTTLAVLFLLLYYILGAFIISTVDDNPAFRPAEADLPPGGSVAVAMTSAVLDREVNTHGWTPDDPWFYPSALLQNMPAYQRGIHMAVYRFAAALQDRQPEDADLALAHTELAYPASRWWIGLDWPWVRTASSSRYDDAIDHIRAYNIRIANGSAPLVRDAATLSMMLEHLAGALAEGEETLDRHLAGETVVEGERLGNDEVFYMVRGEAYASMLILGGLREDFAPLIRERQLSARWANMARSLEGTVAIDPLIVTAGEPGSFLIKNHLMEQGFALQRAKEQLQALAKDLRQAQAAPPPAQQQAQEARPSRPSRR